MVGWTTRDRRPTPKQWDAIDRLAKTERNAELLRRANGGETYATLAKEYGISTNNVAVILRRERHYAEHGRPTRPPIQPTPAQVVRPERCPCCGQWVRSALGAPVQDGELAGLPLRVADTLRRNQIDSRESVIAFLARVQDRGIPYGYRFGPKSIATIETWLEETG